MTQYSKAVKQMLKEGINVYTKSDGGVFITVMGSRCFEIELSLSEIQKWADLYDADKERNEVQKMFTDRYGLTSNHISSGSSRWSD